MVGFGVDVAAGLGLGVGVAWDAGLGCEGTREACRFGAGVTLAGVTRGVTFAALVLG